MADLSPLTGVEYGSGPNQLTESCLNIIPDLKVVVTYAVPWIIQKCKFDADKLLTQISDNEYKLLLLTYAFAKKDTHLIENLLNFYVLKEMTLDDKEWNNFHKLLKSRFEFPTPVLFDILSNSFKPSYYVPKNFYKVLVDLGKGSGLLHTTVLNDSIDILKVLLEEYGFDINERNSNNETPLHIASNKGFAKIVEFLLQKGAQHFALSFDLSTPLYLAVKNNHVDAAEILLRRTVNVNSVLLGKQSLLCVAVEANSLPLVKLLINKGAKVTGTVLHYAVEKGYNDVAKVLIPDGLLLQNDNGYYPLHTAASCGNLEIIELLLFHGSDVNLKTTNSQYTPLLLAIKNKQRCAAELLISEGANVNTSGYNSSGYYSSGYHSAEETPLALAKKINDTSLIKLLVAAGAK